MNIVSFKLKRAIGKFSAGPGRIMYDRVSEFIRLVPNFHGDDAQLIAEADSIDALDLPQKSVSRIHFQKALIFGGGTLVIRLRGGNKNDWHPLFKTEEIEIPIHKRDISKIEELVKEVKFDLFEDTLDDMLSDADETLGYKN